MFITGTTLINKTLPRLLELCQQAFVVLVGPSTPLASLLFRHGVDMLAGTVVVDSQGVWRMVQEGGASEIFDNGSQMVTVRSVKEEADHATVR